MFGHNKWKDVLVKTHAVVDCVEQIEGLCCCSVFNFRI